MNSKSFNPGKYDSMMCPSCYGCGYVYNPNHQPCTNCAGFGLIKWETERGTNISPDEGKLVNITKAIDL